MYVRRFSTAEGSGVEIFAPAKVNLFLEVLGKRADGYHELETLLAAVNIGDTLRFTPQKQGELQLRCEWSGGLAAWQRRRSTQLAEAGESPFGDLPTGDKNLAYRAAKLVQQRSGTTLGAQILLIKRIPSAAGLGGASSDAAATIVAANLVWNLGWSLEQMTAVAAELGSDIPFFLHGPAAVCRGRGERMERVSASRLHLVVVRPPVGLSTPRVFSHCRPVTQPRGVQALQAAYAAGRSHEIGPELFNRLEEPAQELTPWIQQLKNAFAKLQVRSCQMTGSGSSCFGICHSARHARRVAGCLRGMNVGVVYQTTTLVPIEGSKRWISPRFASS